MRLKRSLLRLLLSGGLIAFLFTTVDTGLIAKRLADGQLAFLFVAFLVALADRVLMTYKWSLLLRAKGIRIPLPDLTVAYLVSTFLGLFLPATLGGDALRAYAVSRGGHQGSHVVSSIIVERLLGVVALLLFALAALLATTMLPGQSLLPNGGALFAAMAALLLVLLAFLVVSLDDSVSRRLGALVKVVLARRTAPGEGFRRRLADIYGSYRSFRNQRTYLAAFLLLSLAENGLPVLWTYFISLAFGMTVPLLYFFILMPIVLVLVRLPISMDGFGLQEGAFVYFLGLIGVPAAEAFLLGIASHLLALSSVLPGGLLYLLNGLGLRGTPTAAGRQWEGSTDGAQRDAVGPH